MADVPCDYVFVCDGNPQVGFGHASRAIQLASLLAREGNPAIAFAGTYSDEVRGRIGAGVPAALIVDAAAIPRGAVAVYDTMDDPEDPSVYDAARLASVRAASVRTVFLANGLAPPALPEGIVCVGYKGDRPAVVPAGVHWGFEYAPVVLDGAPRRPAEPGRILVSLGGASDPAGMRLVLAALAAAAQVARIDVLVSPANASRPDAALLRPDQTLQVHSGVPSVAPLVTAAEALVASYGHLAYEAIALGRPCCLIGQKRFQAEYAAHLARLGLAVAAGTVEAGSPGALSARIAETVALGPRIARTGPTRIDGRGLERVAGILRDCRRAA
jgi:spore coat polysaccharide biosynthesis predicted glycosyltransferase SpsG